MKTVGNLSQRFLIYFRPRIFTQLEKISSDPKIDIRIPNTGQNISHPCVEAQWVRYAYREVIAEVFPHKPSLNFHALLSKQ